MFVVPLNIEPSMLVIWKSDYVVAIKCENDHADADNIDFISPLLSANNNSGPQSPFATIRKILGEYSKTV